MDRSNIKSKYCTKEATEIFKDLNLKSVEDLGNAFAEHCGNTYLKEFSEVENIIEKSD